MDHEAVIAVIPSATRLGTGLALVVSVAAFAGACIVKPVPAVVAAPGCDLANRAWQQSSAGPCAFSTWTFVRRQDGRYAASERGCAGATGVAKWNGRMVTLDFQDPGGVGQYVWRLDDGCRTGTGEVMWSSWSWAGPMIGQSAASTLAAAPAP